jgi:flagellar hook-length control protein FliK
MEIPLVLTGSTAPAPGAPAPETHADGRPSFDEALAAADVRLDTEVVAPDSSLAALAALLTLAAPAAVTAQPTTPALDSAGPSDAAADGLAKPAEGIMLPALQAEATREAAAHLTLTGVPGAAEPDTQPPEPQFEPAAPKLRLARELEETPILHTTAPTHEPARLAEARPTATEIPESAVLVQVERALESLGEPVPKTVRVQLQPESLGRLELCVTHGEHGLRVTLTAESAATGLLLERRLEELRQTLVACGVAVAGLSVSVGNGALDERAFLRQRPIVAALAGAAPVRVFGSDDLSSAAILMTTHRAAFAGVDYRI